MTDTRPPEVIVIGDSHAVALKRGCDALGIPAGLLSVSGNFWHMGRVVFDPVQGIRMRGNRALAESAARIRARLGGGPVLSREVPVIVSAGFNLGRLVPRLATLGHVADAEAFAARPGALFLSDAFLRGYIAHHRDPQLQVLRRLARRAPVTVVPPPLRPGWGLMHAAHDVICDRMRASRLDLYQPLRELDPEGAGLDDGWYEADRVHGNARYGKAVIELLRARGALAGCKAA